MSAVVIAVVIVVVAWVWRVAHVRRLTQRVMADRRLGLDGIILGGEGFVLERAGAPAILLLHGAGDTPQTLRYLAAGLYARGFHVAVPLLPGHGRSIRDFASINAGQLIAATHASYRELKATHDWVAVIGLSMGGALGVQLAAETSDLPALGLVAPYLAMPPRIEWAARFAWAWGTFVPIVRSSEGLSILDPEERQRNLAYGVFTAAGLRALRDVMRIAIAALPRVTVPTLIVQSRTDNRIDSAATKRCFARLGAREKRIEWITGAAHVITVDYGHEHVIELLGAWMESHAPRRSEPVPTENGRRGSRPS
jgi:carboxylesterase